VAQHFNWRCDSYFLPGYFSKIENFETWWVVSVFRYLEWFCWKWFLKLLDDCSDEEYKPFWWYAIRYFMDQKKHQPQLAKEDNLF
jgi:hypothetical protein